MGLREKVALALLAFSTQIVSNNCMPRGHSNSPPKSCTKNAKSPELFRFPDVEYPSDFEAGEYCRFRNEYPVQFQKICTKNSSHQALTYEREAKFKRKYDMATKIKTKPEIVTSSTECDCLPHPYCFRKSSFFPDVEYPLSARDTWIPTYWSRLQDAKIKGSAQNNIPTLSTATTPNSNVDTNYNNSPLSSLIKALNIKKELTTPVSDNNYLPIDNEIDNFTGQNVSDTVGVMSSDVHTEPTIPRKNIDTPNEDNKGFLDSVLPLSTTASNDSIKPDMSISKYQSFTDNMTTIANTKSKADALGLTVFKENKPLIYNSVPTTINATKLPNQESSVSENEPLLDIAPSKSIIEDTPKLPILPQLADSTADVENSVPTTTSVIGSATQLDSCISNYHPKNDDVTSETKSVKLEVDQGTSVSNVSTTNKNDTKLKTSICKNDLLGDIATSTTNTQTSDDIPELPVPNESKIQSDIIVSTTTIRISSNIKPETSISNNDLVSDILTSTTQTGDDVLEQLVPNDNIALLNNIVSTTTIPTHSDIKPETSIYKGDGHVNNINSTKNTNTSIPQPHVSELSQLPEKAPLDNTINSEPTLDTYINETDQLGSPLTEMANTKNNKVIPKLPVFVEYTSPIENMVATDTNSTNEDIKSKTGNSTNELLGEIVPTMTNTKIGDLNPPLDILKTPMAHNTTVFSSAQNVPRKDKSPHGNTSTTTKPTQITVDSEEFSTEEIPLPNTDITSVDSSTTNSVLTTPSPFSPNNDIQPINELNNFTNSWVMRQNTWPMVPEYSDDWIIYVDDENGLAIRGNSCEDGGNKSGLNTGADNYGYIVLPTVPDYCDDSWLLYDTGKTTQDLATNGFEPVHFIVEKNTNEGSIPGANDTVGLIVFMDETNSTLKYEYVDDESVSCTEMPYELVVYPEYVNYTWSAFANDSYVLCNPIRDYSDDICLLFIDTNGTIPSGDII